MRSIIPLVLAASLAVLLTPTAHAGGFEIPGAGAADLGRAGAWFAKADSALALRYNPAALARMPSRSNIDVNVGLLFYDVCFDRAGTYDTHGDGTYVGGAAVPGSSPAQDTIWPSADGTGTFNPANDAGVANPRACNQTGPGPVPQLAYGLRLNDKLAFAVGVLAPHARGSSRYGDPTSTVNTGNPDFPTGPTPTRYVAAEVGNLQLFPTIGVAYALHPRLNVGFAFGWGITIVDFTSFTQAVSGVENPNNDLRTHLKAVDGFVPRINISVDSEPVDGLRLMGSFQWTQSVDTHAELTLESHYFSNEAYRIANGGVSMLDNTRLRAGQASVLAFGVNYGLARKGAVAGEIADGLGTQFFDVELSFNYDLHGRMDEYLVNPASSSGPATIRFSGVDIAAPDELAIQKRWKNQYVFRFGGDVNIVPGVFALRAGAWYESSGITPGYAALDFYLPQRVGVTAGATVRINRFDLSLAYAHMFYADTDYRVDGAEARAGGGTGPGTIANNGLIQANMDIVTLGLRYHFR